MNSDTSQASTEARARAVAFADIGDQDTIVMTGNLPLLRRLCLGDASEIPDDLIGTRTVQGIDGLMWEVSATEAGQIYAMRASRPRTDAERVQWIDDLNERISTGFFSKTRQMMCGEIACELAGLARVLSGDKPTTREARRLLRRRLLAFSDVQMDLVYSKTVNMASARTRLSKVGLVIRQTPYNESETVVH